MKYNTCIVFGGESVEHEVSIITAIQLMENMNLDKYQVIPVYITKDNTFYYSEAMKSISFFQMDNLKEIETKAKKVEWIKRGNEVKLYEVKKNRLKPLFTIDLVILSLHGTNCEDGTLSAYFDFLNLPYVGSNLLASSMSQNKVTTKIILNHHNIPNITYTAFYREDYLNDQYAIFEQCEKLGYPLIVKPASLGSSVGIAVSNHRDELKLHIQAALQYDDCILVERAITNMREFNCAVLGNRASCQASIVEEVLKSDVILSYQDKYLSNSKGRKGMASTNREIPANISVELSSQIQALAIQTFKALGNSGVSRIDFIYDTDNEQLYVNEINTIPGSFAYYLWNKGPYPLSYTDLIDRLVSIALNDYKLKENTRFSYDTNILATNPLNQSKLKG